MRALGPDVCSAPQLDALDAVGANPLSGGGAGEGVPPGWLDAFVARVASDGDAALADIFNPLLSGASGRRECRRTLVR